MHLKGEGAIRTHYIVTDRRGRYNFKCVHVHTLHLYVRMCMRAHIPRRAPPPTHLHVLSGCTEAVEGEVLHNPGGPTHLDRGDNIQSHLYCTCQMLTHKQSEVVDSSKDMLAFHTHMHVNTHENIQFECTSNQ